MVLHEALRGQYAGSYNIPSNSHTRTCGTSKPFCNFVAPCSSSTCIPRVSCRNVPFVASTVSAHSARRHRTPLKQNNALVMQQRLLDSCQRPSFSEHWIEECIHDIVKHIHEAPFLQLLFNSEDDCGKITYTQRQRVPVGDCLSADEKWVEMKRHVSETLPDAIILVHDLSSSYINIQGGTAVEEGLATQGTTSAERKSHGTAHLWGVLVLGKTSIAKSACYILETTSTASPFGNCTHFCLTKAQSFGPSWLDQIQSSWLL